VKYALVRGRRTGKLYVFQNITARAIFASKFGVVWEVLAESDDEQLLLTMLELTKETK